MKAFFLFLCGWFFCMRGMCQDIPVLDPKDPEFAWMDELIAKDFANVKRISKKQYRRGRKALSSTECIVRFQVINNQVRGPESPCRHLLEYLCKIYGLPDLDFLYWNQDGPWSTPKGDIPVLVGARAKEARNTILFIDWLYDIDNSLGPWNQDIAIIDTYGPLIPWTERKNQLFWRGSGTDVWNFGKYSQDNWRFHSRGRACFLSLSFPDLIDAAFTGFLSFLSKEGEKGVQRLCQVAPMAPSVSLVDHLNYKYQLQITGLMGNFPRDRWQFYSGSVVFRHLCPHEMYWYPRLKEWEHYIPVQVSMNDLVKKIQWAIEHDEECQKIAMNAREFAETHFMPEHMALYCYKVLLRYAEKSAF